MFTTGEMNLKHALDNLCEDPDCEIHNPEVIEDEAESLTARAWFYAGAMAYRDLILNLIDEAQDASVTELRDAHNLRR